MSSKGTDLDKSIGQKTFDAVCETCGVLESDIEYIPADLVAINHEHQAHVEVHDES